MQTEHLPLENLKFFSRTQNFIESLYLIKSCSEARRTTFLEQLQINLSNYTKCAVSFNAIQEKKLSE